ncbi:TetR/AcrR family transcriptional regulator [Pseudomonas lopnurensis]|uniref:TetR/AcrR family transcriptional regulator n=1 Tax=Pseudomonas lopnurensis TaxID=1477517 RepID=UPI0028A6761E|nr:TetR/AcrR family transcriptional regulator [Pseudomonas lopnurensis]
MEYATLAGGALTEQRIRLAAIGLIASVGYESMGLRQLAREAGVTPSTLYLYFRNKKDLLLTLVLDYFDELSLTWRQLRPKDASAEVHLQAFVAFHLGQQLRHRALTVVGNMELRNLDDKELQQVNQAREGYLLELVELIERGVRQGLFLCDDPYLLAQALLDMLNRGCNWPLPAKPPDAARLIEHYSLLALRLAGFAAGRTPSYR